MMESTSATCDELLRDLQELSSELLDATSGEKPAIVRAIHNVRAEMAAAGCA